MGKPVFIASSIKKNYNNYDWQKWVDRKIYSPTFKLFNVQSAVY